MIEDTRNPRRIQPNPASRFPGTVIAVTTGLVVLLVAGCVAPEAAQDTGADGHVMHDEHILLAPDDMEWRDGPASLPAGARFAVLQGDLSERNFIALRLAFPPDYEIPPHWHEAVEHVTILEGRFYVGMGTTLDKDTADELSAGSFSVIPNTEPHYAFTRDEPVVFQLHSIGPWGITYVDPADDPRA